jgi:ABC-2 type transport system permease protein
VTGAFWYLLRTSAWNRLRRQATRLKDPRYAVAFLLGIGYFWFLFMRPGQGDRPPTVTGASSLVPVIVPLFFILAIGYTWLFGSDRSALAFTPAEVAVLFPAPVSRRALILYKLARSQAGIIFTILIWMLLLRRSAGPLPKVFFAVALWAALSTFTLHRLGVALLRAGVAQHGSGGARRSLTAMAIFAAIVTAVGVSLWAARAELLSPASLGALLRSVTAALQEAPAGIALLPLNLLVAPLSAREVSEWLRTIGPALLILGLHVWWVLRSDAAFEEAAAEASAKQARFLADIKARRAGGGAATKLSKGSARRTLSLPPTGAPAVAILWKNALWLWRSGNLRATLVAPTLALVALLAIGRDGGAVTMVIMGVSATVAMMFLMLSPGVLRNDLRADLRQISLLKTLPLRARDVVIAQILGTAVPAAVGQILLLLVAGAALSLTPDASKIPAQVLPAAMIGAPALLLAINVVNFTIHNGVAVLFPGWVRLGEQAAGGVEATGMMMLMVAGTMLAFALLLLVPVGLGAAVGALVGGVLGATGVAIVSASLVAAAALAGEAYLMILGLAGAYERMEPSQTA